MEVLTVKMKLVFFSVLFLLFHLKETAAWCNSTSPTQSSERTNNAVEIKFYRADVDEWVSKDYSQEVSVYVSEAANAYCSADPGACGLASWDSQAVFKEIHVGLVSGYPKKDAKDMLLKIYIDLPEGSTSATGASLLCVVSKSVAITIIANAREDIHDRTGFWMTYIGDEFYGIPPDKKLNAIIIPIACITVFLVFILAIILHFWNKRRERLEKRAKFIEMRKKTKTAKVQPTYTLETDTGAKGTPDLGKENKQKLYDDRDLRGSSKGATAVTKTASIHSEDSAIKMEEPRMRHSYTYDNSHSYDIGRNGVKAPPAHLQPLDAADGNAQPGEVSPTKEKKKKRRKHKKRSKSSDRMEGYRNAGIDSDEDYSTPRGPSHRHTTEL